ncbi:unnamed protein product, partial [Coregonus sp. 'balchen']
MLNEDTDQSALEKIFRRADKNDDGKLSFDEFNAYFADGILTTEELKELFYSIDGKQNTNLDTDKLSDYFAQHLGEYLNVLSALETLNVAILKAMDKTKEEYQGSSVLGQFVTRFMLRETSSQLLSLQMSLQCAMEAVEEESRPAPREVKAAEHPSAQRNSRRCGRKVQKNMLQLLLDKLEWQSPKLEPLKEDMLASTYKSRQISATEEDLEEFQKSDASKNFQSCVIDMLEDPKLVSTMLLP